MAMVQAATTQCGGEDTSNQADQHTGRRAGSNPPAPAQAVLSLAKGIDSTSHSKSSGSIVPRVPPFKFPHRIVRAQERAMSVSPLFTGDGTVANRESALPIQVRDGRQLHFQSRLAPGHFAEHHAHCTALEATSPSPSLKSDKRSRLPICLYLFSKLYTGCFSYY